MIGCVGYTDVLDCSQYVQDVLMIKSLYIIILFAVSIFLIYFSKTKSYKQLKKKYTSYDLMLKVPIWLAYVTLFTTLLSGPGLLSVLTTLDNFMTYLWAILLPAIVWVILMSFYLFTEWLFNRLGFENSKSFFNAVWKK